MLPHQMERLGCRPAFYHVISYLAQWVPTAPIKHGRGLRQGDPLLPLIFVIAIDPLQKLHDMATKEGHLAKLRDKFTVTHASMYVDDTIIFITPSKQDVIALAYILKIRRSVGLSNNVQKSSVIC